MPVRATLFSMLGGLLALLSSVYAADSLYVVLVSIAGLAVVIVWMSICLAYFNVYLTYQTILGITLHLINSKSFY